MKRRPCIKLLKQRCRLSFLIEQPEEQLHPRSELSFTDQIDPSTTKYVYIGEIYA